MRITVTKVYERNAWRVRVKDDEQKRIRTIRRIKHYNQAVDFGRAISKHEKLLFRVQDMFGRVVIDEDYREA